MKYIELDILEQTVFRNSLSIEHIVTYLYIEWILIRLEKFHFVYIILLSS